MPRRFVFFVRACQAPLGTSSSFTGPPGISDGASAPLGAALPPGSARASEVGSGPSEPGPAVADGPLRV
eukprot:15434049-Alexandrium_andersonii.AAC.1